MRFFKPVLVLVILLGTFSTGYAFKQVSFQPSDEWSGMYLGSRKIGYDHMVTGRTTFEGREVYFVKDTSHAQLSAGVLGESTTTTYIDNNFSPICLTDVETTDVMGSHSEKNIETRFSPKIVTCKTTVDGKVSTKEISTPSGIDLSANCKTSLGVLRLEKGDQLDSWDFSTDRLGLRRQTCKALRKEQVDVHGKSYNALVLLSHDYEMNNDTTSWYLDDGSIVKQELPSMHMTFLLESREEALKIDETGMPLSNGKINAEPKLPKDGFVTALKVRLTGISNKDIVISEGLQSAAIIPGKNAIEFSTSVKEFGPDNSLTLPMDTSKMKEWVSDSLGVEVSDKSIQDQAHQIVGNEKNAYLAAMKLMKWVYENVDPRLGSGTTISAVEILKTRSGDCKHCATLYAAMARAIGIPTRLITGLAYTNGCFFGHAWAESYFGEWVPVDPAFRTETVDATHIRLTTGLETVAGKESAEAASDLLMGDNLKAEILGYTAIKADSSGNIAKETYPKN